jgi:hypothetical protein
VLIIDHDIELLSRSATGSSASFAVAGVAVGSPGEVRQDAKVRASFWACRTCRERSRKGEHVLSIGD